MSLDLTTSCIPAQNNLVSHFNRIKLLWQTVNQLKKIVHLKLRVSNHCEKARSYKNLEISSEGFSSFVSENNQNAF